MKKILVILAALAQLAMASGQTVRLRTLAVTKEPSVRLIDVADLGGLADQAGQFEVTRLTEPGTMKHVMLADVEQALRQVGVNVASIGFSGAGRCEVRWLRETSRDSMIAATQPATAAEETIPEVMPASGKSRDCDAVEDSFGRRVTAMLADQLGVSLDHVSVDFDASCRHTAQQRPEGTISITSSDHNTIGRRRWRIDVSIDNKRYRYNLSGRATVQREIVVAAKDLASGQMVSKSDVCLEKRTDDGAANGMTAMEQVIGQQVSRALRAGEPVEAAVLRAPVLVSRGQTVMVTSQTGSLTVTCRAKALAAGQAGHTVQLERADTQARFWAIVTGPGTARVADGEAGL